MNFKYLLLVFKKDRVAELHYFFERRYALDYAIEHGIRNYLLTKIIIEAGV